LTGDNEPVGHAAPAFAERAAPRRSCLRIRQAGSSFSGRHSSEVNMNRDVFAGWWKQARGQAKSWWGQLTDDDLDRIEGESDKLVGALQTRYGWSRDEAEREIERRMGRAA
jgi:uncharacterized protein YjbJ (UPF0337 family)